MQNYRIKLVVKKVFKGEPSIVMVQLSGPVIEDLPNEYTEHAPYAYINPYGVLVIGTHESDMIGCQGTFIHREFLRVGDIVSFDKFNSIVETCKSAVNRLCEIENRLKSEYSEFFAKKEETYLI